jgi:hypothetical protein
MHGGVATNRTDDGILKNFRLEYESVCGQRFRVPVPASEPIYLGQLPRAAASFIKSTQKKPGVLKNMRFWKQRPTASPLSPNNRMPVKSRVISVLGMHRSGTSCLAGTLMESGVHFGNVSRRDRFNKKGNRENTQIMKLHDAVLRTNSGAWNNPPETARWNQEQKLIRDSIIEGYEQRAKAVWGFKDPRTMFVLEGWLDVLPQTRFVGTFRHHDSVVQSLLHRNPELFTQDSAAELWYRYNKRLLSIVQAYQCKLVAFDCDHATLLKQLKEVTADLELRLPRFGLCFFRSRLRHHRPRPQQRYPEHIEQLYDELQRFSKNCFAGKAQEFPKAAA